MGWTALLATALALALDAFAVATIAGIRLDALTRRRMFRLSFHFGLFQAGMLSAGWLIGTALRPSRISRIPRPALGRAASRRAH